MNDNEGNFINFLELLSMLKKRIKLIIGMILLATLFGGVYSFFLTKPLYGARTQLVFKLPNSDTSTVNAVDVQGNLQLVNTINQVIISPAILKNVKENLNLTESVSAIQNSITATNAMNSTVINIDVKNASPTLARDIANETALVFQQKAKSILSVDNVTVLSEAIADGTPVSPNKKLDLAISAVVGLLIGIALALLLEFLDNTINSEEDIEKILGQPLLGVIPRIDGTDSISSSVHLAAVGKESSRKLTNNKRGR
ncbi:MAG: polysaccharide biosynthesis protein [Streptococcaceae bacterium]|jgi:capsular polysaccharide biosynthesis protein|nr:polysaccharide biosynthesis protein [Streptococcaceae bacterium]